MPANGCGAGGRSNFTAQHRLGTLFGESRIVGMPTVDRPQRLKQALRPLCSPSSVPPAFGTRRRGLQAKGFGVSPLCGAGLLRYASSRCQRPSVSPLTGGHPSRALAATLRARWRAEWRRTAAQGPGRCARQCSDQGWAFIAMPNSQVRPAIPAGITTAALSRARGSRAFTPSRVRERGPPDELTGVPFTPLRFVRCAPARSSPRSPAMPDAGPLKSLK